MTKKGNPSFTCLNCGSSFTIQRGYSMHIVNTKYCYNYYSQPGHNLSKFQHIKDLEFLIQNGVRLAYFTWNNHVCW